MQSFTNCNFSKIPAGKKKRDTKAKRQNANQSLHLLGPKAKPNQPPLFPGTRGSVGVEQQRAAGQPLQTLGLSECHRLSRNDPVHVPGNSETPKACAQRMQESQKRARPWRTDTSRWPGPGSCLTTHRHIETSRTSAPRLWNQCRYHRQEIAAWAVAMLWRPIESPLAL